MLRTKHEKPKYDVRNETIFSTRNHLSQEIQPKSGHLVFRSVSIRDFREMRHRQAYPKIPNFFNFQ